MESDGNAAVDRGQREKEKERRRKAQRTEWFR